MLSNCDLVSNVSPLLIFCRYQMKCKSVSNVSPRYNPDGSTMNHDGMTKDEEHKNTMCKDGRCPDINKKVETGNGVNNDVNTKTDGTTQ